MSRCNRLREESFEILTTSVILSEAAQPRSRRICGSSYPAAEQILTGYRVPIFDAEGG